MHLFKVYLCIFFNRSSSSRNEQENSIESAKNHISDGHDSKPIDWNPTGESDYNPYSEEERWDPYSDEHESDY